MLYIELVKFDKLQFAKRPGVERVKEEESKFSTVLSRPSPAVLQTKHRAKTSYFFWGGEAKVHESLAW